MKEEYRIKVDEMILQDENSIRVCKNKLFPTVIINVTYLNM